MLARSLIVSAVAALLSAAPAAAQNFPNHAITILVPYSPGGPTDIAARVVGEHMAATFGQNVVIENLTGGGGAIAAGRVARAAPDGYTLLLHQLALAANVTLLPNLPYDTEKAFAVTSPERMATLPEVPSVVALGYKDLDIQFWQGLFVAAGTPKPVIDRLNEALQLALADPKVRKSFAESGMSTFPTDERSPEAATAKLRSEIKRWGDVIRANNIAAAP